MTSLAQQLKKLAVPQAQSALGLPDKERKSILFDAKEAANLDKETFYAIGKLHVYSDLLLQSKSIIFAENFVRKILVFYKFSVKSC